MSCREAGERENEAFAKLERAVAHRKRIDAKLAIFDDHWDGYEAALNQMNEAVREYRLALDLLLEKRLTHAEPAER